MDFFETENSEFNEKLKKIETSDRVHADTINEPLEQLIKNDVSLNSKIAELSNNVSSEIVGNSEILERINVKVDNIDTKVSSIKSKVDSSYNILNSSTYGNSAIKNALTSLQNTFSSGVCVYSYFYSATRSSTSSATTTITIPHVFDFDKTLQWVSITPYSSSSGHSCSWTITGVTSSSTLKIVGYNYSITLSLIQFI